MIIYHRTAVLYNLSILWLHIRKTYNESIKRTPIRGIEPNHFLKKVGVFSTEIKNEQQNRIYTRLLLVHQQ